MYLEGRSFIAVNKVTESLSNTRPFVSPLLDSIVKQKKKRKRTITQVSVLQKDEKDTRLECSYTTSSCNADIREDGGRGGTRGKMAFSPPVHT